MSEDFHWGLDGMGWSSTQHRGLKENCSAPECGYKPDCVFCCIVAGVEPANILMSWSDTIVFTPRGPITKGHLLVVPTTHVTDFADDPQVSGRTMQRVGELQQHLGYENANVITSLGRDATQSVFHLHYHLIPRRKHDELALPWDSGKGGKKHDRSDDEEG